VSCRSLSARCGYQELRFTSRVLAEVLVEEYGLIEVQRIIYVNRGLAVGQSLFLVEDSFEINFVMNLPSGWRCHVVSITKDPRANPCSFPWKKAIRCQCFDCVVVNENTNGLIKVLFYG